MGRVTDRIKRLSQRVPLPYLGMVRAPATGEPESFSAREICVASYNVHRWSGFNGRRLEPRLAGVVIVELGADILALQEVLRPFDGSDPLTVLADRLEMHTAFVATRIHRRGELGNAILCRWPILRVECLNLSVTRIERRCAVVAHLDSQRAPINIVATHLSLVDRTRALQIRSLVEHPRLQDGPVVLLGDLNAWRPTRATRDLEQALGAHHNRHWPRTYPSTAPLFSLDRIYTRGVKVMDLRAHDSPASRRGSDHLPVKARVRLANL